jgi:glycosyltransferase involved in cell wall biosynthesis
MGKSGKDITPMYEFVVISTAPVPFVENVQVALHGLRAWGIASVLNEMGRKTLLLTPQDLPTKIFKTGEDLTLTSYQRGEDLRYVRNLARTVIVFGQDWETAKYFLYPERDFPDTIVIVDALVPMSIEYLGQWPQNATTSEIEDYLRNYSAIRSRNELIMKRADYLLCAGENQKFYYQGALSSQGTFSAQDMLEDRIIDFPHKIIKASKSTKFFIPPEPFVLCWFGGLYPWIAPRNLANTLQSFLEKNDQYRVRILGPINHMVSELEPIQKYAKSILREIEALPNRSQIEIIDWVPYEEIGHQLTKASAVLSLNPLEIEGKVSWRTRTLDILNHNIPILTDGIDQIGAKLLKAGMAIRLDSENSESIAKSIHLVAQDPDRLKEVANRIKENKHEYIYSPHSLFATKLEPRVGRVILHPDLEESISQKITLVRIHLLLKLIQNGDIKSLLRISIKFIKRKIRSKMSSNRVKSLRSILVTPEISYGGANLVAVDLMQKFKENNFDIKLTYGSRLDKRFANKMNLSVPMFEFDLKMIDDNTELLIINSISYPEQFWNEISKKFHMHANLRIFLYVHEDKPELFLTRKTQISLSTMINHNHDRFRIASPSEGTNLNLEEFFRIESGTVEKLLYPMEQIEEDVTKSSDVDLKYKKLRFCVVGSTFDDRKNHDLILDIFHDVSRSKSDTLRDFNLTFVGVGSDHKSVKLSRRARNLLGERYLQYSNMSQQEVIDILRNQDVLISISIFETLPKNVMEAMATGTVLIRNTTSGHHEQLVHGRNGFLVDEHFPSDIKDLILMMLDPSRYTVATINEMKNSSQKIAEALVSASKSQNWEYVKSLENWVGFETK